MSECTTHHHACDCREAKFAAIKERCLELEKENAEQRDIIQAFSDDITAAQAEIERLKTRHAAPQEVVESAQSYVNARERGLSTESRVRRYSKLRAAIVKANGKEGV